MYSNRQIINDTDSFRIQGVLAFSNAYSFGMPLRDGMLIGIGPWAAATPSPQFTISGKGPVAALKVECDQDMLPYKGRLLTAMTGSGMEIVRISDSPEGFNARVKAVFPTYATKATDIDTTWSEQSCEVQVVLNSGKWSTGFEVDEWRSIKVDQAKRLVLADTVVFTNPGATDMPIDPILDLFAQNSNLEYQDLTPKLKQKVIDISNSTWFAKSQGSSVSNFLRYATRDGQYYSSDLMWRGVAMGLGATMFQVMVQGDRDHFSWCEYFGVNEEGHMLLGDTLPYVAEIMLLISSVLCMANASFVAYRTPVTSADAFKQAAFDVSSELRRHSHISSFTTRVSRGLKLTLQVPSTLKNVFSLTQLKLTECLSTGGKSGEPPCPSLLIIPVNKAQSPDMKAEKRIP
jgi:hypothetical protein